MNIFKSTQEKEYSRLANAHLDLERQAPRGCSKEAEPSFTPAETSGSPHQVVLLYSVTYKLSHNLEWKDKHGNVGTSAWLFL